MLSIMAYVQIYENNDVDVIQDKIEHMSYFRLYIWKVDHVLSVCLINDEKQQFVQVSHHPPATHPARSHLFFSPCVLLNVLTITAAMSRSWIQPAPFVVWPLSGGRSLSRNTQTGLLAGPFNSFANNLYYFRLLPHCWRAGEGQGEKFRVSQLKWASPSRLRGGQGRAKAGSLLSGCLRCLGESLLPPQTVPFVHSERGKTVSA